MNTKQYEKSEAAPAKPPVKSKSIGMGVEGRRRMVVLCPICEIWVQPAHGTTYGGEPALCCSACGRPLGKTQTI